MVVVAAGGRRSSVAERWQLKPEALGSTPGGATFLSCPLPFQRSTDSDGPDCVFQLDTIGLRTTEESHPSDTNPSTAKSVQMKLTVLFSGFVLQTTATDSGLGHHGLSVRHVTPEQHSYMWTFPDRRSVNWNIMSRQQHH